MRNLFRNVSLALVATAVTAGAAPAQALPMPRPLAEILHVHGDAGKVGTVVPCVGMPAGLYFAAQRSGPSLEVAIELTYSSGGTPVTVSATRRVAELHFVELLENGRVLLASPLADSPGMDADTMVNASITLSLLGDDDTLIHRFAPSTSLLTPIFDDDSDTF